MCDIETYSYALLSSSNMQRIVAKLANVTDTKEDIGPRDEVACCLKLMDIADTSYDSCQE